MKLPRRRFLYLAVGAVALPAVSRIARAQTYPSRPITIVVPYAPGAATDVIARNLAERMKTFLGQPVIIENVTGAGGTIAVGRVARAAPDGYTFSLGQNATHVTSGATYPVHYDLLIDFEPVALLATTPLLLLAKNAMPADDLKGLIAWLKANPDKAAAATTGVGSAQHVAAIYFQNKTDTRFAFVPYRGGAPAIQDLVGGQIDLMFATAADAVEQISAGNLKSYAVMDHSRLAAVPSIPNVDEAGLPGVHFSQWGALFAPKGTPKDAIAKLNAAIVVALADSAVRQRLGGLGQDVPPRVQQTPKALAAFHKIPADMCG
jgi:tripartite-type tricarboxylate transporter receptor subunit TctC